MVMLQDAPHEIRCSKTDDTCISNVLLRHGNTVHKQPFSASYYK